MKLINVLLPMVVLFAGCASSYSWKSSVPMDMRTVSVPVFVNKSNTQELGAIASRQLLREFQREGTFKLVRNDDSVIEIQGEVLSSFTDRLAYSYSTGQRISGYDFKVTANVSVIDHKNGRVLIDNKRYVGSAPLTASDDLMNAARNASGAAADDLARQIVADVLNLKW